MDFLRSCYSTECRFYRDDPRTCTIQWYFVDEDTPDLGFGTCFTSNEWLDVPEGDQELGEVPGAARTWKDGTAPWPNDGSGLCGTELQFQQGESVPPAVPIPLNVYGGPACCPLPADPFIHYNCPDCPTGSWSEYSLLTQGGNTLSVWGPSLGNWSVTYAGACIWRSQLINIPTMGPHRWNFTIAQAPKRFRAFFERVAPGGLFWVGVSDNIGNCLETTLVPAGGLIHPPGFPESVVILPGQQDPDSLFCPAWSVFLPDKLLIRIRRAGVGIIDVIQDQDMPMIRTTGNTWESRMLWQFRAPALPIRATVGTDCVLEALFPNVMQLRFTTPHGAAGVYESALPAWDLSPQALMLQAGGPWPAGLPLSVLLYAPGNLPP